MSNTIKKTGIELIADERRRQIEEEGFDAQHDAQEDYQELAGAAVAYVFGNIDEEYAQELFPWDMKWWKPRDTKRNLVRAGALIAAALDRYTQQEEEGTLNQLPNSTN